MVIRDVESWESSLEEEENIYREVGFKMWRGLPSLSYPTAEGILLLLIGRLLSRRLWERKCG